MSAQRAGSDDVIQATEAREIFLEYLAKSLLEESQSYIRFTKEDWAQLTNDIVERSVFGKAITKPIFASEKDALAMIKEALEEVLNTLSKVNAEDSNEETRG